VLLALALFFPEQPYLCSVLAYPIAHLLIYNIYKVVKEREDLSELEHASLF